MANEIVALAGKHLFAFEHLTPNLGRSGQGGQGAAKCFDGQPAVVAALGEGVEGAVPGNLATPGGTSIIL